VRRKLVARVGACNRRKKVFFFEKKKQKTFCVLAYAACFEIGRVIPSAAVSDSRGDSDKLSDYDCLIGRRRFAASEDRMTAALKVTWMDHTASEPRGLAAKTHDAAQSRRLLAACLLIRVRYAGPAGPAWMRHSLTCRCRNHNRLASCRQLIDQIFDALLGAADQKGCGAVEDEEKDCSVECDHSMWPVVVASHFS
jgi:hypothetical protein